MLEKSTMPEPSHVPPVAGPPAFSLGIFLFALSSHINIGVRHILPVYLGFSVTAAIGKTGPGRRSPTHLPRSGSISTG